MLIIFLHRLCSPELLIHIGKENIGFINNLPVLGGRLYIVWFNNDGLKEQLSGIESYRNNLDSRS